MTSDATGNRHGWRRLNVAGLTAGALAASLIAPFAVGGDRTVVSAFRTALAARSLPAADGDRQPAPGFDASAVRLSRLDGRWTAPVLPASVPAGADHAAATAVSPSGALLRELVAGDRIVLSGSDGRSDTLEVVSVMPLAAALEAGAAPLAQDGGFAARSRGPETAPQSRLLLVTLRIIDQGRTGADRTVRLVIDAPASTAIESLKGPGVQKAL